LGRVILSQAVIGTASIVVLTTTISTISFVKLNNGET